MWMGFPFTVIQRYYSSRFGQKWMFKVILSLYGGNIDVLRYGQYIRNTAADKKNLI